MEVMEMDLFQFLIGKVQLLYSCRRYIWAQKVSIPHR